MALPQLNDLPKYDLVIPSTKESVTFRPFLVKEQKVLLMALEAGDEKQILRAILDTIAHCLEKKINVDKLATFDIEYMFTQIRSKSAGETTKLNLKCIECDEQTETVVNLDEIKIEVNNEDHIIELNDTYSLKMRYPSPAGILLNTTTGDTITQAIFEMIVMCLDEIRTEEEIIKFDEETRENIDKFVEGLTTSQLEKLMNFVNNLPKLRHDIEFECSSCSHKNKITLEGLQDFF